MNQEKRKRFLKWPRWLNHIYAILHAYFWAPCPLCGKMFGGHEAYGELLTSPNGGEMVCPYCADEAKEITMERFRRWQKEGAYDVIWPPSSIRQG